MPPHSRFQYHPVDSTDIAVCVCVCVEEQVIGLVRLKWNGITSMGLLACSGGNVYMLYL